MEDNFDLETELQAPVFRDWGIHFKHQDELQKAIDSFDRSLETNPEMYKSMLERSICKLQMNRPGEALASVTKCMASFPNRIEAKHVYANSVYELNRIEDALVRAYGTLHEHPNDQLGDVFINTVMYNVRQAAGQDAGPLLRHLKYNLKKQPALIQSDVVDGLEGKGGPTFNEDPEKDCDVISITGESHEKVAPLDRMRKQTIKTKLHEIYYDMMVREQIVFWENLKKHKAVSLSQTPHSSKILTDVIDRCLKRMHEHERMLYSREPLYVKRAAERGHPKNARLVTLYYMQQDTRREALSQLKTVKRLMKINIVEAIAYVEKIMVTFYAVKSTTVFPRKYEFMCEVFNNIGMYYLYKYQAVPPKLMDNDIEARLNVLLQTPTLRKTTAPVATRDSLDKFGDRSVFVDPDYVDQTEIIFSKRADYFVKRISYSNYAIEKAYLNYQLSEHYMNCGRLEESQQFAREVVVQASQCQSNVWKFIGYLNIVRADALKRNFTRVTRNLKEMTKVAAKLSKYVEVFVRTAVRSNEDIEAKRADNRRMSRMSRASRMTVSSRQSSASSSQRASSRRASAKLASSLQSVGVINEGHKVDEVALATVVEKMTEKLSGAAAAERATEKVAEELAKKLAEELAKQVAEDAMEEKTEEAMAEATEENKS